MLENVKVLLGITGNDLNSKLEYLIDTAEKRLLAYLPDDVCEVPEELEYIVVELAVARFNRLGNEAMSSYSQDGESITYSDNDIESYMKDINAWIARDTNRLDGVVVFL